MEYSFREHFLNKSYVEAVNDATNMLKDARAFDAIHIIGLSLVSMGQAQEGIVWLEISLAWPGAHASWFINAGMTAKDAKDYKSSLSFLEQGLSLYPDNSDLHRAYGLCLSSCGRWEDSIASFDMAFKLDPSRSVLASKGVCLHMLGKDDEAIALWRSSEPDAEVTCTWACMLMAQGKQHEALDLIESQRFDPEPLVMTYNKSIVYLGMGNWPLAWKLYRSRALMIENGTYMFPVFKQPFAESLDDIRDKHVLLFSEQGLGDSVMFIRFAELLRPFVAKLTLLVSAPLVRLMQSMQPSFDVLHDFSTYDACHPDVVMPMLDAPTFLETTVETIPPVPHFNIPADHKLPYSDKPRVGLVWAGNNFDISKALTTPAQRRSMPFETMRPLLDQSGKFTFISLQMSDYRVDDPRLLKPLRDDFDMLDTAAIIQQLDLIITIDSVVAHVAGSLGKPVWLLSRFDGCWRWFWDDREDSPWYPTLRLYRQKSPDSWPEVIGRVAADLSLFH
jgi:tetratricopeptide (TPR) repeat protein